MSGVGEELRVGREAWQEACTNAAVPHSKEPQGSQLVLKKTLKSRNQVENFKVPVFKWMHGTIGVGESTHTHTH